MPLATPSVTVVLAPYRERDFVQVAADIMQAAQERGIDFHALAAAYAAKAWIPEVPDSCTGFFESFTRWFDLFVEEVILVEQTLVHPIFAYTGTPDIIVRLKGDGRFLSLIDWKTPQAFSKSWRLQLAAYQQLAVTNGHAMVSRVASLQPHPKGRVAKFNEYTASLVPDFAVFLAALTCWRFFNAP